MAGRGYGIRRACQISAAATATRDAATFKLVEVTKVVSGYNDNKKTRQRDFHGSDLAQSLFVSTNDPKIFFV